jgi:translocator protein
MNKQKTIKLKWYHGLVFLVVVNFLAIGLGGIDVNYYETLNLPSFTPPRWLFAPVWIVNNVLLIWANIMVFNSHKSGQRRSYLVLQVGVWLNYIFFQYLTFGLKNTSMFFFASLFMLFLVVLSVLLGYRINKKVVFGYITLFPWLILATSLGYFVMILN